MLCSLACSCASAPCYTATLKPATLPLTGCNTGAYDAVELAYWPAAYTAAPLLMTASYLGHTCPLWLLWHLLRADCTAQELYGISESLGPMLLCMAAAGGHSTTRLLLQLFPGAATVPVNGRLAIHRAAETGAPSSVIALLEAAQQTIMAAAEDPDADSDTSGFTPLHFSCMAGNAAAALALVSAAAITVTVRDSQGRLPLHIAAQYGQHSVIPVLLQVVPHAEYGG